MKHEIMRETRKEARSFIRDLKKLFVFRINKKYHLNIGAAHPVMQAAYILIGSAAAGAIFLTAYLALFILAAGLGFLI